MRLHCLGVGTVARLLREDGRGGWTAAERADALALLAEADPQGGGWAAGAVGDFGAEDFAAGGPRNSASAADTPSASRNAHSQMVSVDQPARVSASSVWRSRARLRSILADQ